MIAAVASLDRKVMGVQVTYLADDGSKAARDPVKQSFGLVRGYGVHLAPVTDTIVLAEGVESALSFMVYNPDWPAWAVLSAYFLKHVILPPSVRTVTIAGDREDRKGTGEDEAAAAAEMEEAKYNVKVEIEYAPDCCNDWNTFLQRERDAERRLQ
jgi:DNA primase